VNLVDNAVKFTAGGSVLLQAAPDTLTGGKAGVRFSITDTGIGIEPEKQERLFKPFSQGDSSTTRQYEGSGLGLVICDRLCRAMGGEIHVDSVPGAGSTFRFTLPAPESPGPEDMAASLLQAGPEPRTGAVPAGALPVAVVICGDRLLRTLLIRLVAKAGFAAKGLETVEDAMAFLAGTSAPLVILDFHLVSEREIEFAESLAEQISQSTALAVVGGELGEEDRGRLHASGVAAFLPRVPKVADFAVFIPKNS
jgi:hypothetical protein